MDGQMGGTENPAPCHTPIRHRGVVVTVVGVFVPRASRRARYTVLSLTPAAAAVSATVRVVSSISRMRAYRSPRSASRRRAVTSPPSWLCLRRSAIQSSAERLSETSTAPCRLRLRFFQAVPSTDLIVALIFLSVSPATSMR